MRKASDPKAPSPLPSFVVRTYQLGSLEFLPLSSTLSAADARRRRPFAHPQGELGAFGLFLEYKDGLS